VSVAYKNPVLNPNSDPAPVSSPGTPGSNGEGIERNKSVDALPLRHSLPGVITIQWENLKHKNALSPVMMADLHDIVDDIYEKIYSGEDTDSVALVLKGTGNTFCSGFGM
jgi:hypothetical protein